MDDLSGIEPQLSSTKSTKQLDFADIVVLFADCLKWERGHPEEREILPDLAFHRLRHAFHVYQMAKSRRIPLDYLEWRRFCRRYTATAILTIFATKWTEHLDDYIRGHQDFLEFWGRHKAHK